MNPTGAHVICGGLTFEEVSVELREKVAFREAQLPEALVRLRNRLGLREAVLVSTCNRVEYFGATTQPDLAAAAWPDFLREFHSIREDFSTLSFQMRGMSCVEHLYSVASGIKSMVVGETEVLGQLKDAYDVAQTHGQTGKWLNRLFQSSFAAAKSVRSRTAITRGMSRSVPFQWSWRKKSSAICAPAAPWSSARAIRARGRHVRCCGRA